MDQEQPQAEPFVMERKGKLKDMDRRFDVSYWQRQGPNAIFAAAWEMVVEAHRWKGGDESELELQRSVEVVRRVRS